MNETFSTDEQKELQQKESRLIRSLKISLKQLRNFLKYVFSLGEIDFKNASDEIRKDVVFKGFNVWILIFSVLICSIGLNLNSTAVVIGAMLISPLMGPINGIGFSIAIIDRQLLRQSLKSFAVALVVSIVAAFIFFSLAPATDQQSELLARTRPTLLDLFVAFFGGLAGILSAVRRIKNNVVPGVAIATALMPPLCTAGFGLATGQWNFFLGAIYLFFINSVFISLSALLITRYLRFPMISFIDAQKERRARLSLLLFIILISIPSIVIYVRVLKHSFAERRLDKFIEEQINPEDHLLVNKSISPNTSPPMLELGIMGKELSKEEVEKLKQKLLVYGLEEYELKIYQSQNAIVEQINEQAMTEAVTQKVKLGLLEEFVNQKDREIARKDSLIQKMQKGEERRLMNAKEIKRISEECSALFPDIEGLSYSPSLIYRSGQTADSLYVVFIESDKKLSAKDEKRFALWFGQRMKISEPQIRYE